MPCLTSKYEYYNHSNCVARSETNITLFAVVGGVTMDRVLFCPSCRSLYFMDLQSIQTLH